MKVRASKVPVEIDAVQWAGNNIEEIATFVGSENYIHNSKKLIIITPEGSMEAHVGDWVIKGVEGEFYPCKNSVWKETYFIEKVYPDDTPPVPGTEYYTE
jgi:hypothetical protein